MIYNASHRQSSIYVLIIGLSPQTVGSHLHYSILLIHHWSAAMEKIVVVVEEAEAAITALKWALHNILRCGDVVTLLHVYPTQRSKSKRKLRRLRLKGFQLALSFRDICNAFPNVINYLLSVSLSLH